MDWLGIIIAAIVPLTGVAALWLSVRKGRKKETHDAAEIAAQVDKKLWDRVNARLTESDKKIEELEAKVDLLETRQQEAVGHVIRLEGLIPTPPGAPKRPAWMPQPTTA